MADTKAVMRSEEHETRVTAQTARQNSLNCPSPRSRRATFVVFQKSAERLVADDVFETKLMERSRRWQCSIDGHVAETLARPLKMIVDQPRLENMPEMVLTEDHEMVETLCLRAAHPDFGIGIQVRTPGWNGPELDAVGFQDRTELGSELRVAVSDDVDGLELGRLFGKEHSSRSPAQSW
jgi:hypothetical protein